MIDPVVYDFFNERKEAWRKKTIKPSMTEKEITEKENLCEETFAFENWLPDAAKRAGQISISSHPCTFSHSSARKNKNGYVTSVIANAKRQPDGYLRSGNTTVENDALGNAAALDVYKFLMLILSDDKTVLEHIENDTDTALELLSIDSEGYETLKTGFLAMLKGSSENITSSKIKQVYFPTDGKYHLLSLLTNSGLVFECRKRIDGLRFGDELKVLRDKRRNKQFSEIGYSEVYNITTIGYGGTKPQNISVLNNQNGGKAHLLLSVPPILNKHEVVFPKKDFFKESISYFHCREALKKLDKIFQSEKGKVIPLRNLKLGRDRRIEDILDHIIERQWVLRDIYKEQYNPEKRALPYYQQVWLCEHNLAERANEDQWLDDLVDEIIDWIARAYINESKRPITMGQEESHHIRKVVDHYREAFR